MNEPHPSSETWTLHAYGETPPEERASLEEHLETCAACRAEVAALRRVMDALDTVPVEEPAPEQWDAMHRAISGATRRARNVIPLYRLRAAAAAAVFLLGLSLGVFGAALWWKSAKAAGAAAGAFAKAEALEAAGRNEEARAKFAGISRDHPGTDWAELSAFHLRTLEEKRIVTVREVPEHFNPGGPKIVGDRAIVFVQERWGKEIATLRHEIDLNYNQPERNAMRLVMIGEIYELRLEDKAAAADSYREALALAPGGALAELAERRLERLRM